MGRTYFDPTVLQALVGSTWPWAGRAPRAGRPVPWAWSRLVRAAPPCDCPAAALMLDLILRPMAGAAQAIQGRLSGVLSRLGATDTWRATGASS